MDSGAQERQTKLIELEQIMERVKCNAGTNSEDCDGVVFIKDADPQRLDVRAANLVFDGLMITLSEIAEDSLAIIEKKSPFSQDYEPVLRAMEPITTACRGLAEGHVPLQRNETSEQHYREAGDDVHIYETVGEFKLGDRDFDSMGVFIRPKAYVRSSDVTPKISPDRPQIRLREPAAPRMTVRLFPRNSADGFLEIRFDQDAMEITYDIIVGDGGFDRLNKLKFAPSTNQRYGHHFSSSFTAKQLGVTFEQILNAMNEKVAASVAPALNPEIPEPSTPQQGV
jgi:hypothetical protein